MRGMKQKEDVDDHDDEEGEDNGQRDEPIDDEK
jgi:hypothetical protein